jgi:hypothetical protein
VLTPVVVHLLGSQFSHWIPRPRRSTSPGRIAVPPAFSISSAEIEPPRMNLPSCEAAFDAEIRATKMRRNFMIW